MKSEKIYLNINYISIPPSLDNYSLGVWHKNRRHYVSNTSSPSPALSWCLVPAPSSGGSIICYSDSITKPSIETGAMHLFVVVNSFWVLFSSRLHEWIWVDIECWDTYIQAANRTLKAQHLGWKLNHKLTAAPSRIYIEHHQHNAGRKIETWTWLALTHCSLTWAEAFLSLSIWL